MYEVASVRKVVASLNGSKSGSVRTERDLHTMHLLISVRKSTPLQNRQLNILISDGKQHVDDCMGGLTF